ncbi:pseudouridine synthase [Prosthecobacter fluviatilis]|uniref:Pseudouridine synthase n=1 Tax=Prosthecobacter fluviatilis TaxID=445931 RepID=A0ABW0KN38_9BACT
MLIAFYKPFDVLSQFTQEHPSHRTLAEFGFPPHVYAIGRLDRDSEGLLLLSDEARWNDRLLNPRHAHPRTYHAQVDGTVTEEALKKLRSGIDLKDFHSLPCKARRLETEPPHPPRTPPIRVRKNIPTSWLELTLTEGKNRQVRRMTAAVGHPTLRLIRVSIGSLTLQDLGLSAGHWRGLTSEEQHRVLPTSKQA